MAADAVNPFASAPPGGYGAHAQQPQVPGYGVPLRRISTRNLPSNQRATVAELPGPPGGPPPGYGAPGGLRRHHSAAAGVRQKPDADPAAADVRRRGAAALSRRGRRKHRFCAASHRSSR